MDLVGEALGIMFLVDAPGKLAGNIRHAFPCNRRPYTAPKVPP